MSLHILDNTKTDEFKKELRTLLLKYDAIIAVSSADYNGGWAELSVEMDYQSTTLDCGDHQEGFFITPETLLY